MKEEIATKPAGKGKVAEAPLTDEEIDLLLTQLTSEEIEKLLEDTDPDDKHMPPSARCTYHCDKAPTGPLNRKGLLKYIYDQAKKTPDRPDYVPHVPGTIRGTKWVDPNQRDPDEDQDFEVDIDLGDEIEMALGDASTQDMIDLAGIMGLHSLINQEQYHAATKGEGEHPEDNVGWDGITKATPLKYFPPEEPNPTNPDEVLEKILEQDEEQKDVNLNNVPVPEKTFLEIFGALKENRVLSSLSISNTSLTDWAACNLAHTLESNPVIEKLNIESNNVTPGTLTKLFNAINVQESVTELKALNQASQCLGNRVEMAITKSIENNKTLLKVGLQFEFNDCRNRVAVHLQKNLDRIRLKRIAEKLASRGNVTAGYFAPPPGSLGVTWTKATTPESEYEYYYSDHSDEE